MFLHLFVIGHINLTQENKIIVWFFISTFVVYINLISSLARFRFAAESIEALKPSRRRDREPPSAARPRRYESKTSYRGGQRTCRQGGRPVCDGPTYDYEAVQRLRLIATWNKPRCRPPSRAWRRVHIPPTLRRGVRPSGRDYYFCESEQYFYISWLSGAPGVRKFIYRVICIIIYRCDFILVRGVCVYAESCVYFHTNYSNCE